MVGQDHIGIRESGRRWLRIRRDRARRSCLAVRRGIEGHLCGHGLLHANSALQPGERYFLLAACLPRPGSSIARPSWTCCATASCGRPPSPQLRNSGSCLGSGGAAHRLPAIVCKTAKTLLTVSTGILGAVPRGKCIGVCMCVRVCGLSNVCPAAGRLVRLSQTSNPDGSCCCMLPKLEPGLAQMYYALFPLLRLRQAHAVGCANAPGYESKKRYRG